MLAWYFGKCSKLKESEDGAVAIFVALALVVLIGAIGAAIDMGRGQLLQSKLSSSLDAAGLAAASTINTNNLTSDVEKYMNVNFQEYLGSTLTDLSVSPNSNNTVITLSASASLPTVFMGMFGIDTMLVSATSEITRAINGLELVMVLDNTGSMSGTKLSQLKTAAKDLVGILYGDGTSGDKLWVGLVPFAQAVNIGPGHASWLNPAAAAALDWGPTSWMGCVEARDNNHDSDDEPPTTHDFTPYYWADDGNNDWIRSNGAYRSVSTARGPNKSCSQEVLPMTSDQASLENAIDNMEAVGNTHINLGAVWGWRMLSPNWRGQWGGDMNANDLPLDYNAPRMSKAIIIMTDGENTVDSGTYTAYKKLGNGKLGTTNANAAISQLNGRLMRVCNSMKHNNIIVYTIAFGNPGNNVQSILRNCATQSDYYFNTPTGDELQAAFHAIGDSLSSLRVSK